MKAIIAFVKSEAAAVFAGIAAAADAAVAAFPNISADAKALIIAAITAFAGAVIRSQVSPKA
jgi:hypothetical protein